MYSTYIQGRTEVRWRPEQDKFGAPQWFGTRGIAPLAPLDTSLPT